jgi:DnaK suppressor protein
MLFASLLQGFGLLPKRNESLAETIPIVLSGETGAKTKTKSVPKQGITPEVSAVRSKADLVLTGSEAKSGPTGSQRIEAVKKTAEDTAPLKKIKTSVSKKTSAVPETVPVAKVPKLAKEKASLAPVEPTPVLAESRTTKQKSTALPADGGGKLPVVNPVGPKKSVAIVPSAAAFVPTPIPAAVAAPVGRRAGRKAVAASTPTAQPKPSHSPDAAKATFSIIPQRVMTPLVHSPARKDPKLANNWKSKPLEQLLDEDVLSMPDDEYMNETQLAFFRRKLVVLKEGILTNAGQTTENLRAETVVVPDPTDRATIEEEHALELRTRDRERKLLKKIEQSIARIDNGDYGYCDETGEAIGAGRLIARPTANLSLEAQQRRELKQKMFGD